MNLEKLLTKLEKARREAADLKTGKLPVAHPCLSLEAFEVVCNEIVVNRKAQRSFEARLDKFQKDVGKV